MENVEQFKLLAQAVMQSFQEAESGDVVHEEVFVTADCVCDAAVRKTTATTASPPNI